MSQMSLPPLSTIKYLFYYHCPAMSSLDQLPLTPLGQPGDILDVSRILKILLHGAEEFIPFLIHYFLPL